MASLAGKVAVVAGASRGAGRGIALALGDAGATVYVAGRTRRGGPPPTDGATGTIDDTSDEVTARGGRGIAVGTDFTDAGEVAALFDRVRSEHGRLDLLANAVWGGSDAVSPGDDPLASWALPFWEKPATEWHTMMNGGPYAYYLASREAARIMVAQGGGLIVGLTDGIVDGVSEEVLKAESFGGFMGQMVWDLAHTCINRLMYDMSVELKKKKVAVITLMPGFMRTERVVAHLKTDELKHRMGFDKAESTEYVGRAIAHLAADRKVMKKTGRIHFVADLAQEYGFTDIDGVQVPRFNPFS